MLNLVSCFGVDDKLRRFKTLLLNPEQSQYSFGVC